MIPARRFTRFLAAALALTLILGVVPAFADDAPSVVTFHVVVLRAGDSAVDLIGLNQAEAHDAIAAACPNSALQPLQTRAAGKPFAFDIATSAVCDIDAMVTDAMNASADATLTPRWSVDPAAVKAFVARVTKGIARKAVNARRTIVKHRLKLVTQADGRALGSGATLAVNGAVAREIAAAGAVQPAVTLPVSVLRAKVRTTNIGKTILVVLHERRVYLYKNGKVEKSYRCAIGMPAHKTPQGTFKVVSKSPHPSWHNPGSGWAKGMPRVIGPGYYNPLGLRALYLNAPGIRIHGTSKTSSMGRAASHGCIRLTNKNVVDIYPRVPVGTPVYILS